MGATGVRRATPDGSASGCGCPEQAVRAHVSPGLADSLVEQVERSLSRPTCPARGSRS